MPTCDVHRDVPVGGARGGRYVDPELAAEAIDVQRHAAEKFHAMHRTSATATTPESATSSTW
jgi:hypothetical protein